MEHTPLVTIRTSTGLRPPELRPNNGMESLNVVTSAAQDFILRVLDTIIKSPAR
jgi:hypothetical protein